MTKTLLLLLLLDWRDASRSGGGGAGAADGVDRRSCALCVVDDDASLLRSDPRSTADPVTPTTNLA